MATKDEELDYYVARFYKHLMTPTERAAHAHLTVAESITHGLSTEEAQRELLEHPSPSISHDPAVLQLAAKGLDRFLRDVRDRILHDHAEAVHLNCCPRCGALTRTPHAQWCPSCGHDWHRAPAS